MLLNAKLTTPLSLMLTLTLMSLSLAACGDGKETPISETEMEATLAIIGSYSDGFSTHDITAERWTTTYEDSTSIFHVERFDNELGYLIAQNDASNEFAPELWSRFDWLVNGEELWYCQISFDAESAEDAANNAADPSDPSMGGCGDFPWSLLNPAE